MCSLCILDTGFGLYCLICLAPFLSTVVIFLSYAMCVSLCPCLPAIKSLCVSTAVVLYKILDLLCISIKKKKSLMSEIPFFLLNLDMF